LSQLPGADLRILPDFLAPAEQQTLLAEVREIVKRAPFFTPIMPRTGKPFSVAMTCAGPLGWVSDKSAGYRYQDSHPVTGTPWPEIPASLVKIWQKSIMDPRLPDCCLVNYYRDSKSRMSLHQDRDEADFSVPVLSVSLGDTARFRIGTTERKGPTKSFKVASGTVLVLQGASRLAFHGIDRIYPGTSTLLKDGGRINLTLRRAG
jgi:alkylated DNA repair protein (DNA oxidative demethylase)